MRAASTRDRVLDLARLLLVVAAIVGVLGMHALVIGTPNAEHTSHASHLVGTVAAEPAPSALVLAPVVATPDGAGSHGSGHDPADHSGLAHLCLALAAAIFLLLVRRFLVPAVLAGPPGPVVRVRATTARWTRPPPDLVGAFCVSRT